MKIHENITHKKATTLKNEKHGMDGTSIYKTWVGMKSRCLNRNDKNYWNYGKRGISVCQRWVNSFVKFYEDMGDRPSGKSLDRVDNDKGYSPENCRWATASEQGNNKSNNHKIKYNGEIKTITQWSRCFGIPVSTIINRINRGCCVKESLTNSK